jgi:hypothetical protein
MKTIYLVPTYCTDAPGNVNQIGWPEKQTFQGTPIHSTFLYHDRGLLFKAGSTSSGKKWKESKNGSHFRKIDNTLLAQYSTVNQRDQWISTQESKPPADLLVIYIS